MSSNNASRKIVSVDEQAFENAGSQVVDEDGFPVVDETPEFEPAVEQETQAKVDANHPDGIADTSEGRIHGATLEQEERIQAREAELERISAQAELGTQEGREQRTRNIAAKRSAERRVKFQRRAASVNLWVDPERGDPHTELTQEQLATVNKQSMRLGREVGWLVESGGQSTPGRSGRRRHGLMSAVVAVFEELQTAPGQAVPIEKLEDVERKEVSVEGQIEVLWDSDSPAIAQVGLIADDSGKTKVTIWEKSDAPWVEEGEQVRIHNAARNWYEGHVSIAVTGWTTVHFPERGRWWE
jgi:hypothetical protein